LFFAANDRSHLICLKLGDGDSLDLSIVEAATRASSFLQSAMNGIPGNSFYPRYHGLVHALDAEGGNLIEGGATMLESMVWRTGIRAERLTASTATISTTPPPVSSVESVTNDVPGTGFSR
jgi:hypothetical protein